jgi:hypothetical protein
VLAPPDPADAASDGFGGHRSSISVAFTLCNLNAENVYDADVWVGQRQPETAGLLHLVFVVVVVVVRCLSVSVRCWVVVVRDSTASILWIYHQE